MVMIIRSRKNLEISCTKGVILTDQDKLFAAGKNNQIDIMKSECYFSISLSQWTWFGDQVAIQISGLCPSSNRSRRDIEFL